MDFDSGVWFKWRTGLYWFILTTTFMFGGICHKKDYLMKRVTLSKI